MQVAAAEENDDFTIIHIRFLDFLFGKEEECLGERCQDLLEGVVGLFVQLYLPGLRYEIIADNIHIRIAAFSDLVNRRVDPPALAEFP